MKELLFRGKSLETGAWVEGGVAKRDGHAYIFKFDEYCKRYDMIAVDPDTVGQFIGIYDRYDTKIFEGDVVDGRTWVVTHYTDTTNEETGEVMEASWYLQRDNWDNFFCLHRLFSHEVLGNIYDNPELLIK